MCACPPNRFCRHSISCYYSNYLIICTTATPQRVTLTLRSSLMAPCPSFRSCAGASQRHPTPLPTFAPQIFPCSRRRRPSPALTNRASPACRRR
ncbi:hypothetical protein RHA1_ro10404 (plasmid) [Rhodococcus jostii RHA1]|uniref:Uncharacterized protein n=1 Tax=Rhodococcus jostii (strain RHA1) TaxID=101510 RepID=Q0RVU3_RHOJR|nr:hypothetical protein RHA1_ro10404 [Rhodococcus jostii RHA1]